MNGFTRTWVTSRPSSSSRTTEPLSAESFKRHWSGGELAAVHTDSAATWLEVEAKLRCADETRTLRLGTVGAGFQEIASRMPISNLLSTRILAFLPGRTGSGACWAISSSANLRAANDVAMRQGGRYERGGGAW